MKPNKVISISFLVLFVVSMISLTNYVFADHMEASVSIPQGTSVQGCEENGECYLPYEVTVDVGGEVTWSNDDSAAHTVTAGTPIDGPSGLFDSSLFMTGTAFSHTFEVVGEFPYFCMVHPWMEGIVTVQAAEGSEPSSGTIIVGSPPEDKTTVSGITIDGKIRSEITVGNPIANEVVPIEIKFRDSSGAVKKHSNYDLSIVQNEKEVLSISGGHDHEGIGSYVTAPLVSADPVDIKVTVLGFGLPNDEENWSGPRGEIMMFNVVPEFGTVAIVVMFAAIASVVILSSRFNRVMPNL